MLRFSAHKIIVIIRSQQQICDILFSFQVVCEANSAILLRPSIHYTSFTVLCLFFVFVLGNFSLDRNQSILGLNLFALPSITRYRIFCNAQNALPIQMAFLVFFPLYKCVETELIQKGTIKFTISSFSLQTIQHVRVHCP